MLHRTSTLKLRVEDKAGATPQPEPGPIERIQERLAEIDLQLRTLGEMHRLQGDALAGRLIATLERERDQLLAQVVGRPAVR